MKSPVRMNLMMYLFNFFTLPPGVLRFAFLNLERPL